ncbi:MAG TPA: hypothetical protein VFV95_07385 [Vicinamibacterales bacterium]|nr:hypothetical protein [Vicinamibacterales bacterium]
MPFALRPARPIVLATIVATAVMSGLAAQAQNKPERYLAHAVNLGNAPVRWTSLIVEMAVTRWSTDAERDRLTAILLDDGPNALLKALQDMPRAGYIRTPDSIGYDLRFARKYPGEDGGERVVLATDRYIGFWEATNRPRTIDYPFTVVEMRIGPNGEGEGKMSLFTKIIADKKSHTIVLEDYGTQPVLLQHVRKETE